MPRLRVLHYRSLNPPAEPEQHELELPAGDDVVADGATPLLLVTVKAQVASITGLAPEQQHLAFGDAACPIEDDVDVRAFLINVPAGQALHVLPKAEIQGCWRGEEGSCTRVLFGERAVLQPAYVIPGSDQPVCHACNQSCFPLGLLIDAVGAPLRPFACAAPELCAQGLGAYVFEGADQPAMDLSPPALAIISSLEEQALAQQALAMPTEAEAQGMVGRLRGGMETVMTYENSGLQAKALKVIPLASLHERALAAGGDPQRRPAEYKDLLFRELLAWFKRYFFQWVNNPKCDGCASTETELVGGAAPTPAEAAGKAGRVEVYKCKKCSGLTRFPRYNDPGVLLDTRRGRCGEWANCFTLCCRAVGLDARYVLDWTDHVWTEVFSEAEGRWLHADSCENLADHPLVYEAGWGKQLSYVVAFGREAAVDVTRRYTRQFHSALLARRTEVPEALLARQLASLNSFLRTSSSTTTASSIPWTQVDVRLRREQGELRHHTFLDKKLPKPSELQGRVSGDAVWKRIRGEDGKGAGTLAAGGCGTDLVATCAVPLPVPPNATDASAAPAVVVPIIEREDVAGLPLWSSSYAHPSSLLVALTSTGASDLMGAASAAAFGPEAIAVNGLGVAVGTRGLNLVVVDLVRGLLERSVAIDAAVGDGDGDDAAALHSPVQAALAQFLSQIPKGRMVLAVVLGSGHALGGKGTDDKATWGQGGFPSLEAPGRGQAWLVAGEKDGGAVLKPWAQALTREEGKGPARVVVSVPLPSAASQEAGVGDMRWEGGIAALPLLHDMGPAGDGVVNDPQAAVAQLRVTYPGLPVSGHSHKPGYGLLVFGPISGIQGGAGWTSVRPAPGAAAGAEDEEPVEEEGVKVRMKRAFDKLVADGVAPNLAAAQALVVVKQEAEARAQRQRGQQVFLSLTERVGGLTRPADGEAWAFDDTEVAVPLQAAAECHQAFPSLALVGVRLWSSPRGVTALQAGYASPAAPDAILWAPAHRPSAAASFDATTPPAATLTIAPGDRLVRMDVRPGPDVVEALKLTTQGGQTVLCGRRDEPPTVSVKVEEGLVAVAFFGAVGREGLQSLGLVQARLPTTTTTDPESAFPWGVYTACPVDRAARQMLLWAGADGGTSDVLQALQAAKRYLGNCLKEPVNPTFRRIRCRTAFFHRNIGRLPGSGHLMRALGFQHVASVVDAGAEACYELPLARASPVLLERLVARLDANIARVEALLGGGKA